jgi:hypothetical protein
MEADNGYTAEALMCLFGGGNFFDASNWVREDKVGARARLP